MYYIMNTKTLFIFHRSLRIEDNIGLYMALKNSQNVIPIFIFTPEQITSKNIYRSKPAIQFMIGALEDVNNTLKEYNSQLYFFYGNYETIIKQILSKDNEIDAIYINKDYTPYALERERNIEQITKEANIKFAIYEDCLLHNVNTIKNKSNTFYSVYTPFYKNAITHTVNKPLKLKYTNFIKKYKLNSINLHTIKYTKIELYDFKPTRQYALERLAHIKHNKNYDEERNILSMDTTKLSPYIKFGLVSVREVYHKIKKLFGINHGLIKQLYWREFYYNLTYNRQDILTEAKSFRLSYDKIKWKTDNKLLLAWQQGKTGYPIVDAGMRELNKTGYMHNRSRLITSNFLVKHLFIDWRDGEKYYASKLIDYDPMVNNGSWQFTSGSGADSQPYFRMMNPILQSIKFDNDCSYIKKWVEELKNISSEDIHNWHNVYMNYDVYYPPCKVYDFNELKKASKKVYSKAFI